MIGGVGARSNPTGPVARDYTRKNTRLATSLELKYFFLFLKANFVFSKKNSTSDWQKIPLAVGLENGL